MEGKIDSIAPLVPNGVSARVLLDAIDRFAAHGIPAEDAVAAFVPTVRRIFLHEDEAPRRALVDRMREDPRIAGRLLVEVFEPVARAIGTDWAEDRLSFVEVTIAAARLQEAVRGLVMPSPRFDCPPVAVVVPPWEQHTLSPAILAARLQLMGASVQSLAGLPVSAMAGILARSQPEAVLISVGGRRSAARLVELVALLRETLTQPTPIVVGGPATALDAATCGRSGADLVTSDLPLALRFCGIDLDREPQEFALPGRPGSSAPALAPEGL